MIFLALPHTPTLSQGVKVEQRLRVVQSERECERHNAEAARKALEERLRERERELNTDLNTARKDAADLGVWECFLFVHVCFYVYFILHVFL